MHSVVLLQEALEVRFSLRETRIEEAVLHSLNLRELRIDEISQGAHHLVVISEGQEAML